MNWYIIALIVYVSPGVIIACASAVHSMANQHPVRLLGMFRVIVLWPLVLLAALIYAGKKP